MMDFELFVSAMKKSLVCATVLVVCALISRAQVAVGGENAGQYKDVQLQGVRVRLGSRMR